MKKRLNVRLGLLLALVVAGAGSAWASAWAGNNASGVWNLGSETHIDSSDRFLLNAGTVNVNEGAFIKVGGNSTGNCNYIGVDSASRAVLNINGGTFWASTAKSASGGWVAVAINATKQSAEIIVNTGLLKIDNGLRFGTYWNSDGGAGTSGGNGALTVNGGTVEAGSIQLGTTTSSNGGSYLYLRGGLLKLGCLRLRGYAKQYFWMQGGTLQATAANLFTSFRETNAGATRDLQAKDGFTTRFDVSTFAQTMPVELKGAGKIHFTGTGAVTFEGGATTYGVVASNAVFNLSGADLSAETPALTVGSSGLELAGPLELKVTLPADADGVYPLVTNVNVTASLPRLSLVTVTGGGAGRVVLKGTSLCLDLSGAATGDLVYSDAAGGAATPSGTSYDALHFTSTAGAFTLVAEALEFAKGLVDEATATQVVTSRVTLAEASRPVYVAEGGTLKLTGGLVATTPIKDGAGTLVFEPTDATVNTWLLRAGALDFNGHAYAGGFDVWTGYHSHLSPVTLTNGLWRMSNHLQYMDYAITLADGFTLDLTGNDDLRVALGYGSGRVVGDGLYGGENVGLADCTTRLTLDGGALFVRGTTSAAANFVGVDYTGTAELLVRRGHFCMTNRSDGSIAALRIGAGGNARTHGRVTVSDGAFDVYGDLSIATVFSGLNGNAASGSFEQTGGTSLVWSFYLGQATSGNGTGTVSLTGGEMSCHLFNLLPCGTQTLSIDGFTLRALGDDTSAAAPFFYQRTAADAKAKTYTLGAGGLTVDSAGHTVTFGVPLAGEGAVTVTGGGTVRLAGDLPAAGGFTVATNTTFALTGTHAVPGGIRLESGAALQVEIADNETVATPLDALAIATPETGRVTLKVAGSVYAKGVLAETAPAAFDMAQVDVTAVDTNFTATVEKDAAGRLLFTLAPKSAFVWTGAQGGAWKTDANWAGSRAPDAASILIFDDATTTTVENDFPAGTAFALLNFPKNAPDYAIGGTAFTLTGTAPINVVSSNAVAITAPVTLAAAAPALQVWQDEGRLTLAKLTATKFEKKGPGAVEIADATEVGPVTVTDGLLKFTDADRITPAKISATATLTETPIVDFGGATRTSALLGATGPKGSWFVLRNGCWDLADWNLQTDTLGLAFGSNMNFRTTRRLLMGYGVDSQIRLEPGAGTLTFGGNSGSLCNFIAVDNSNTATVDVQGGLLHCSSANGTGGYLRIAIANGKQSPKGNLYVSGGEVRADKEIALCSNFDGAQTTHTQNGTATVVVGGTGLVTAPQLSLGFTTGNLTPTANLSVTNGGTLALGELRCYKTVKATVSFDGGTIRATKDNANWLADDAGGTHVYTVGANGLTLDANGFNVGANLPFGAASAGDVTLVGGGSFTINAGFSLPTGRSLTVGATGVLALDAGTTSAAAVTFADGATVSLPGTVSPEKRSIILTAPAITGLPTTTLVDGKRRGAIYRVVEQAGGLVGLQFQLGGTLIYIR